MDNSDDLNDRIFARYERARVLTAKLSNSIGGLVVPLAILSRYHRKPEWMAALKALIESPVEIGETFDLLVKTDMVEVLESFRKELDDQIEIIEKLQEYD